MNVDDVRAMYDEPPEVGIPRFTSFTRECVGVLLAEIDRLQTGLDEAVTVCHNLEGWVNDLGAEVADLKARLSAAYDRVAVQSELLSKRAEVKGGTERP